MPHRGMLIRSWLLILLVMPWYLMRSRDWIAVTPSPARCALELIMGTSVFTRLRTSCLLVLGVAVVVSILGAPPASANTQGLAAWQSTYGGMSSSGDIAQCQLCHANDPAGTEWNGYGWDIRSVFAMTGCNETWEAAFS